MLRHLTLRKTSQVVLWWTFRMQPMASTKCHNKSLHRAPQKYLNPPFLITLLEGLQEVNLLMPILLLLITVLETYLSICWVKKTKLWLSNLSFYFNRIEVVLLQILVIIRLKIGGILINNLLQMPMPRCLWWILGKASRTQPNDWTTLSNSYWILKLWPIWVKRKKQALKIGSLVLVSQEDLDKDMMT